MWKGAISAKEAVLAAGFLAASDAEGTLIKAARKLPSKVRNGLRIWESNVGEKLDVVNDKVFAVAALSGGIAGGVIHPAATAIFAPEALTIGTTAYHRHKTGEDPVVSQAGKIGMIGRFAAIGTYLASSATEGNISDGFAWAGHASMAVAVGSGLHSAWQIVQQARHIEATQHKSADTLQ